MSYNPVTDFLALLRQSSAGATLEQMPGLDYVVAALARAGMFQLSVGQTAPTANQATTVWLKPSTPSWAAEGTVYLWNAGIGTYVLATPQGWDSLFAATAYQFQAVTAPSGIVTAGASLLAIQRAAPTATALLLPSLGAQLVTGRSIKIVDWSTAVARHVITLTTPDGATIMQKSSWSLLSTADQSAGTTLYPSPDLNGWVIAP